MCVWQVPHLSKAEARAEAKRVREAAVAHCAAMALELENRALRLDALASFMTMNFAASWDLTAAACVELVSDAQSGLLCVAARAKALEAQAEAERASGDQLAAYAAMFEAAGLSGDAAEVEAASSAFHSLRRSVKRLPTVVRMIDMVVSTFVGPPCLSEGVEESLWCLVHDLDPASLIQVGGPGTCGYACGSSAAAAATNIVRMEVELSHPALVPYAEGEVWLHVGGFAHHRDHPAVAFGCVAPGRYEARFSVPIGCVDELRMSMFILGSPMMDAPLLVPVRGSPPLPASCQLACQCADVCLVLLYCHPVKCTF